MLVYFNEEITAKDRCMDQGEKSIKDRQNSYTAQSLFTYPVNTKINTILKLLMHLSI